jgi:hypothetical protein
VSAPEIPTNFPAQGRAALEQVRKRRAAETRIRVRRTTGEQMLGVGETTYIGYERSGEIEVVVDRGIVWTLTDSIYDKMERDIVASYADGDMPKAIVPGKHLITKKAKSKRPRSEAQRAALARENERRAEAKRAREAEAVS